MLTGIIICFVYVAFLTVINKLSGVKYTDILKSTHSIRNGLLIPVAISTTLLLAYAILSGWIDRVFSAGFSIESIWLWIIPLVIIVGAIARLTHISWRRFEPIAVVYLIIASFLVGFSEELLVRGILVKSLQDAKLSIVVVGLVSSLIFGILHFVNFINGQDKKTTLVQMANTALIGFNFYIILGLTGTLWAAIILHFVHDLSLLLQGGELNKPKSKNSKFDSLLAILLLVLPIVGIPFLINW